ncbi:hypothetical protein BHE74_00043136 [Ensete ventricosum]|nr:hypothetical protein BHE74_00043136 [Ensete ventricosum]
MGETRETGRLNCERPKDDRWAVQRRKNLGAKRNTSRRKDEGQKFLWVRWGKAYKDGCGLLSQGDLSIEGAPREVMNSPPGATFHLPDKGTT